VSGGASDLSLLDYPVADMVIGALVVPRILPIDEATMVVVLRVVLPGAEASIDIHLQTRVADTLGRVLQAAVAQIEAPPMEQRS